VYESGNSGYASRVPAKGDPAFDGIELQLADLRCNPVATDAELLSGLYRDVAPLQQVYNPTKRNKY